MRAVNAYYENLFPLNICVLYASFEKRKLRLGVDHSGELVELAIFTSPSIDVEKWYRLLEDVKYDQVAIKPLTHMVLKIFHDFLMILTSSPYFKWLNR